MSNYKLLMVWLLVGVTILGCELPDKPNFKTSQKIETPLLLNKEYQFLGSGNSVLIDTTSADFDSLFTVDGDNFITLSKEQEFEFGDLNDAIPAISASATDFNSQVGEIELGSFSSGAGSNIGEASFTDLTGIPDGTVGAGDPVPVQTISPAVTINLDTDFFRSATFKSGSMDIVLENNLGFNLDNINLTLISDPDENVGGDEIDIVSDATGSVNDGDRATISLPFNDGDQLANPNVRVSITWTGGTQNFQRTPVSLVVVSADGNNLLASQVQAAVESQDFSSSSTTSIDATEFQFSEPDHYVELESGTIDIAAINNDLDMDIDSLIISFPGIRRPPYREQDSLRIRYLIEGGVDGRILRGTGADAKQRDLAGFRIFALNNEINYNIYAVTENTKLAPANDQIRVINEAHEISSSVQINDLVIAQAFGDIQPQNVLLGEDDPSNGLEVIDLNNEIEVEVTEIGGLDQISTQVDGLEFTQASMTINYNTNIGVPTTIVAAIVGTNGNDEKVYLRGTDGEREVLDTDPITGIMEDGVQIPKERLVKFSLDTSPDGNMIFSSELFDNNNTNVSDFLNNLPSEIRFVGKAVVNQSASEATISTPLEFEPTFAINLPLAFRTESATTFKDTIEVDAFADFPSSDNGDDANLKSGELILNYTNGLPLGFGMVVIFLDENGSEVTRVPQVGEPEFDISGADVDDTSRFSVSPNSGTVQLALTEDQLKQLYRVTSIVMSANLRTRNFEEVKVRASDTISLTIGTKITFEANVN